MLRYTQSHRLDDPMNAAMAAARGGMEEPYDGVAELWWESEESLRAAGATEAGRRAGAALLADEAEFIDLAASPLWLAHEYPQVNPTPETIVARPTNRIVKLHFPLRHVADLSFDEAQRYWRVQHGPLIRSMAPAMGMLRYQQVHRFETPLEDALRAAGARRSEPYTGHAEAWFERGGGAPPEAAEAGGAPSRTSARSSTCPARPSGSARNTSSSTASDRRTASLSVSPHKSPGTCAVTQNEDG